MQTNVNVYPLFSQMLMVIYHNLILSWPNADSFHHADLSNEECNFVERSDEECFTNIPSASITGEATAPEYAPAQDFQ